MAELTVRFDLSFGARTVRAVMAAAMVLSAVTEVASESVTLQTYYPAPTGVYTQLITTNNTYLARDGGNVGIGTTAPLYKLDISGGLHTSGGAQIDANLNVNGTLNTGGAATIGQTLTINGAGLYNKFGAQLVETSANDWTRWNQSQGAANGNAMYQSLSLGTGGLSVGAWSNQSAGNVYATGTTYLTGGVFAAQSYVNGAGTSCSWTSFNVGSFTPICGAGQYVTMESGQLNKWIAIDNGVDPAGEALCCTCPANIWGVGYANGCPSI